MSVTLNSLTFSDLLAQPLAYSVTDIHAGSSARIWEVSGLVSKADYASLIGIYDTWRDAKILEDNPKTSLVTGTTVTFTGTGPGGLTWSSVPCWFHEAPEGTMVSSEWMTVQFAVIDAAERIEQIQKDATDTGTPSGLEPDFGDYILVTPQGNVTIELTEYPDTYTNGPTLGLTSSGAHYLSGPFQPYQIKEIEGYILETDVAKVKAWYEDKVSNTTTVGDWYPTSAPEFSAEYVGATLKYTVSFTIESVKGAA